MIMMKQQVCRLNGLESCWVRGDGHDEMEEVLMIFVVRWWCPIEAELRNRLRS